ncbi:MAG: hypothetical protein ACTSUE_13915 [Promethearchaeota archaeon]
MSRVQSSHLSKDFEAHANYSNRDILGRISRACASLSREGGGFSSGQTSFTKSRSGLSYLCTIAKFQRVLKLTTIIQIVNGIDPRLSGCIRIFLMKENGIQLSIPERVVSQTQSTNAFGVDDEEFEADKKEKYTEALYKDMKKSLDLSNIKKGKSQIKSNVMKIASSIQTTQESACVDVTYTVKSRDEKSAEFVMKFNQDYIDLRLIDSAAKNSTNGIIDIDVDVARTSVRFIIRIESIKRRKRVGGSHHHHHHHRRLGKRKRSKSKDQSRRFRENARSRFREDDDDEEEEDEEEEDGGGRRGSYKSELKRSDARRKRKRGKKRDYFS